MVQMWSSVRMNWPGVFFKGFFMINYFVNPRGIVVLLPGTRIFHTGLTTLMHHVTCWIGHYWGLLPIIRLAGMQSGKF